MDKKVVHLAFGRIKFYTAEILFCDWFVDLSFFAFVLGVNMNGEKPFCCKLMSL